MRLTVASTAVPQEHHANLRGVLLLAMPCDLNLACPLSVLYGVLGVGGLNRFGEAVLLDQHHEVFLCFSIVIAVCLLVIRVGQLSSKEVVKSS